MEVYRIANAKYKEFTLTGIGAEKVGGRWHERGTRAVYCSENISLALLEYYIHSQNKANLPKEILIAKIQFPNEFIIDELQVLPEGWSIYPYGSETIKIFTNLSKNSNFFALKVPSAIVGVEYNIILNPLFQEFGKVEISAFIQLPIDQRLR